MAKNNKGTEVLMYAISIGVIIAGVAIAYYYAIALPQIQTNKQNLEVQKFELEKAEKKQKTNKQRLLSTCGDEAIQGARSLLESKIEIAEEAGAPIPLTWKEVSKKGLFLKEDYNTYYEDCVRRHGL